MPTTPEPAPRGKCRGCGDDHELAQAAPPAPGPYFVTAHPGPAGTVCSGVGRPPLTIVTADERSPFLGSPGLGSGKSTHNLRGALFGTLVDFKGDIGEDDHPANRRPEPTEEEATALWGPIDVDEAGPEESR